MLAVISTPFIVALENAKPHYLEHTCHQNKEPIQFNLRCVTSVVDQINLCKMEIKAFDEIVRVQHIFHFQVFFYLQKKRTYQSSQLYKIFVSSRGTNIIRSYDRVGWLVIFFFSLSLFLSFCFLSFNQEHVRSLGICCLTLCGRCHISQKYATLYASMSNQKILAPLSRCERVGTAVHTDPHV